MLKTIIYSNVKKSRLFYIMVYNSLKKKKSIGALKIVKAENYLKELFL